MSKAKHKSPKKILKTRKSKTVLGFVLLFAVIASIALIATRAAGPSAFIEPENANITSPAVSGTDSTASNGRYVKFAKAGNLAVSSVNPCIGAPAPAKWNHVIVIMFENKTYTQVIGSSLAPYITGLAAKCGTAYSGSSGATPKNNWHDANWKVNGTSDGSYNSKPSYATLTSGLSPSVTGIVDDTYATKTSADNIYNQLRVAGKSGKNYFSHGGTGCAAKGSGDYHDPIRYYTNIDSAYCDAHDVNLTTFMTDVNSGNLADFTMILPQNTENMHDNSVDSGDAYAKNLIDPILDSAQYKKGDTAIFFLWDEETGVPNVLISPSIKVGSKVPAPTGNPISHFAGLRTFDEMLGLPLLNDASQAPSLLNFYNGN